MTINILKKNTVFQKTTHWMRSILFLSAITALFLASPMAQASENCLTCHENKSSSTPFVDSQAFEKSSHGLNGCTSCHMDISIYPHPKKRQPVDCTMCHSDVSNKLHKTFHADLVSEMSQEKNLCVTCHGEHQIHKPQASEVNKICSQCHADINTKYEQSIHGKATSKNDTEAATCNSCHGSGHSIERTTDSRSPVYHLNLPKTCGQCHGDPALAKRHNIPVENAFLQYLDTSHGRGLTKSGLLGAANCADCHGSHTIQPEKEATSSINRSNIPETCGKCHAGVVSAYKKSIHGTKFLENNEAAPVCTDCHEGHKIKRVDLQSWQLTSIDECGGCHLSAFNSYRESYHGKITALGYTKVARCSDCHGSHDILPETDKHSKISKENILATCSKCHPGATTNFTKYVPHADYADKKHFPLFSWVAQIFTLLLFGVFAFWWLHTLLWFIRSYIEHHKTRPARKEKKRLKIKSEKHYWRFNLYHRATHAIIIVSFLGLASTGLPLKFSDKPWAVWMSHFLGGFQTAGFIHRVCAILTFIYAGMHLGFVIWKLYKKKDYNILWGPDSLVPQPRDLAEFTQHIRWFFGLAPRPKFGRWSYWEKFDYWAVFWGIAIIGGSGLTLWFPTFFTHFMPGWLINLATIVHSDEALLATGFIFTVHFFNSHIRPEKFPMDDVIFTGRVTEEELIVDKPGQYETLLASGQLEEIAARPTEPWLKLFAKIVGYTALGIGLILALLIFLM